MRITPKSICAFAMMGLTLGLCARSYADPLTIKTMQGKIHGKTINDGKVKAFLGLPYAAPPVGELRWKAPEPPAGWKGARDATMYGPRCAQGSLFKDMAFQDGGPSEDCLFLNVYAPAGAKEKSKLPVMFWIHGGGYVGGAASEPRHNGDFLPLKGVVLVTINYRLGVFGFFATSELAREGDGAAGNYGLLDVIAALHWVNANIAKFGGDPNNVTIFGESAGSFAVSTLMASPMAQGLFEKAIGESGAAFPGATNLGGETVEEQAKEGDAWMDLLGAKSLKELRAMPASEILAEAAKKGAPKFAPDIDGRVLTEPVPKTYTEGKQVHVPLLAGWNRDEGSFFTVAAMTVAQWKAMAEDKFKARAGEFLKLYPGNTGEEALRSAMDFTGDSFIAFGTWKWIEAQCKTGDKPVYNYHLELPAPPSKFNSAAFAFHSDDIEYVFGVLDTRPGAVWRPEDRKLSDEMMSYWTNFARTGDPNGPGLPEWPQYCSDHALIHLDSTITSGPSSDRSRYEFLMQGIPSMQM